MQHTQKQLVATWGTDRLDPTQKVGPPRSPCGAENTFKNTLSLLVLSGLTDVRYQPHVEELLLLETPWFAFVPSFTFLAQFGLLYSHKIFSHSLSLQELFSLSFSSLELLSLSSQKSFPLSLSSLQLLHFPHRNHSYFHFPH